MPNKKPTFAEYSKGTKDKFKLILLGIFYIIKYSRREMFYALLILSFTYNTITIKSCQVTTTGCNSERDPILINK